MVSQFGEIKIDERKDQHKTQLRHIRKPYSHWIVSVMSYFILIIIIKKNNNIYIVICHLFSRYLTQRLYMELLFGFQIPYAMMVGWEVFLEKEPYLI